MHCLLSCLTSHLWQHSSSRACSPGNSKASCWHHSLTSVIVHIECFVLAPLEKTIWNDHWKVQYGRLPFIWHSFVSNTLVLPKPVSKIPTQHLIYPHWLFCHRSPSHQWTIRNSTIVDYQKLRCLQQIILISLNVELWYEFWMVVTSCLPPSWAKCQLLYQLYISASCLTIISSRFDYLNRFGVILMWARPDCHSTLSAILAHCLSHHGVPFHQWIMRNSTIDTWITLVPFKSI